MANSLAKKMRNEKTLTCTIFQADSLKVAWVTPYKKNKTDVF